jgi:nicotinamide-nucleotide adenylyltransferase
MILKKKKVLFIGRFQPFHKGHLGTIQKIAQMKDIGELVIGIGSSEKSFTSYNPFTVEEREEMIRSCLPITSRPVSPTQRGERRPGSKARDELQALLIQITIVQIPDIPDNDEWTRILLEKYFDGEVVYSGNSLVIELLTKAGKEVRIPPQIENLSGTEIRKLITVGEQWELFVPKEAVKIIKEVKGEERIKKLLRL